jgi:hypothetical protein
LIAPSSQFTFGTGNPSTWVPKHDLAADPQVIPGAFYDGGGPYQTELSGALLTLTNPVSGAAKTFSLRSYGLYIEYTALQPLKTSLPLALDPWHRFENGWGERYQGGPNAMQWGWNASPDFQVQVSTDGDLVASGFTDTREMMNRVENPNTEFPPGHYLPFPVAGLEITGDPGYSLDIRIMPQE